VRSGRRLKAEHVRDYGIVVFRAWAVRVLLDRLPGLPDQRNLLNLVDQNATVGYPRVRSR